MSRPPSWARALLATVLPRRDRDWLLTELEDLYRERFERSGSAAANRWLLRQIPSFWLRNWVDRGSRAWAAVTDPRTLREMTSLDTFLADLRYALRRLVRTPGFTAIAVLSLALGIGANTAMFSVVNAVLLRELPIAQPDRVVEVYTSDSDGYEYATSSYLDFADLRDNNTVFEGVIGTRTFLARYDRGGRPELAFGELVSWDYFEVLGVPMALGRGFLPEEDESPGSHPVTILGYRKWVSDFGADRGVLGQSVYLNGRPYTVIGVAPEDFSGTMPVLATGFFAPLMMTDDLMGIGGSDQLGRRGSRSMFVKARLLDGVTLEQANQALAAISAGLAESYPETNEARVFSALGAGDVSLHPLVDRMLVPVAGLLLVVVGIVLLIACANLASFLLARAEDRRKEIALRLALGSGRGRLIRQLMVETVLLASLGGVAGILIAQWTLDLVLSFQPPLPVPISFVVELDGTVMLFTAIISVVAGLAFGLAPALQATNPDVAPTLKDEGSGTGKPGRLNLRNGLVVVQVAFSFVLLIGAGLFIRSLQKAQSIDPGFDTSPAALIWPMAQLSGYETNEEVRTVLRVLEERLRAHPQIDEVAVTDRVPLGAGIQTRGYTLPGLTSESLDGTWDIDNAVAMPGYFEAMDIPIVRGRGFRREDLDRDPVAVVSQAFVDRFYPGEDVVGMSISTGGGREVRIVGVARDTKVRTLGEAPRPYIYESVGPDTDMQVQFIVRGSASAPELLAIALNVMKEVDPDLIALEAKTMNEHLALMLFAPRMAAFLLGVFGGLALLLSGIGIYGVVSYAVARRTREMGIRISLGASRKAVIRMAVGGGMRLVVIGGTLGVIMAAGVTRLLAGYLYGISSSDVATFVAIPVILSGVALFAAFVPARRAASVDPVRALRSD